MRQLIVALNDGDNDAHDDDDHESRGIAPPSIDPNFAG